MSKTWTEAIKAGLFSAGIGLGMGSITGALDGSFIFGISPLYTTGVAVILMIIGFNSWRNPK